MDTDTALLFLADHKQGVLMTQKRDGRPQASNIVYGVIEGALHISVTESRAKTKNLRRDSRASLHVTSSDFWRFVVVEGTAELTETTKTPGDAVGQQLLALYNHLSDTPHPNEDEFLQAMVDDKRLVIKLRADRAYGQLPG